MGEFAFFDYGAGEPRATVSQNGVVFNKYVVSGLGWPESVWVKFDDDGKRFALEKADLNAVGTASFFKKKSIRVKYVRLNGAAFMKHIVALTGWDLSRTSYRLECSIHDGVAIFDMKKAKELK